MINNYYYDDYKLIEEDIAAIIHGFEPKGKPGSKESRQEFNFVITHVDVVFNKNHKNLYKLEVDVK